MRKLLALASVAVLTGCVCAALSAPPVHAAPTGFVRLVDNPWLPLRPGTTYVYRGVEGRDPARDVLTVTHASRTIQGVRCTVVRDRLYLGGRLAERTTDWYAQDAAGNVWYFGEATRELDAKGGVTSTEGSWEAGVDGARAGISMPAHPHVGQRGVQERYRGHAEDHFAVLSLSAAVHTPAVSSRGALLTREWTPLEPGVLDHKLYVRDIGTVSEETVKGGAERLRLVAIRGR